MNKYAIGENIYRLLRKKRMTQHELAARIQSHDDTVSRWMTGQRQPSAYALLRISRELGVTMEQLMEGVDDEKVLAE